MKNAVVDDKYLDMATKIVASAMTAGVAGQMAINNPGSVAELFRAIALEIITLRQGEYELPHKQ